MPLPRTQQHRKASKSGKKSTPGAQAAKAAAAAAKARARLEADESVSSVASRVGDGENAQPISPQNSRKRQAEAAAESDEKEPDSQVVFEDPYGDDYESEEDVIDGDGKKVKKPPKNGPMTANEKMVFRPGIDKVGHNEVLVYDESAYDTYHALRVEWPSLSFDFICSTADGEFSNMNPMPLNTYPLTVTIIAGTQAADSTKNQLVCMKMSNLHKTRPKRPRENNTKRQQNKGLKQIAESSDSESSSEEESDDDEEDEEGLPEQEAGVLQSSSIKFGCTVNRLRVMPQRPNIAAVWGESGRVSLVDVMPALDVLNRDNKKRMSMSNRKPPSAVHPFFNFSDHRCQGFALDWSRISDGRLLSGACNGSIYLWEPSNREGASWSVNMDRFKGHRGSVEDIQWSPNEANVFASCGVDKSIRFWDTRQYRKPALAISNAHDADVNVMSWNRSETHLVVSGGDDGVIRVWDLRSLNQSGLNPDAAAAAEFKQHTKAITSVQWHPKDASMLCASSEDGTVTVWDLAVERDAEEELREGVVVAGAEDFPPQLLFIHMGQKDVKDAQWHPACPSLLVSTAETGFNVFKPANITLPD